MQLEHTGQFRIGLIEDDPIMGESIRQRLALEGYQIEWWQKGADALSDLKRKPINLLLLDIRLPDTDGESLYPMLLPALGKKPIIVITAHGKIEQAVRMMNMGVNDYLTKPFSMDALLERISMLLTVQNYSTQLDGLEVDDSLLIEKSPSAAMKSVVELLEQVKDLETNLLITGESGVGKELAAYYAHSAGIRSDRPFIAVNCATIPNELFESELFGYEKGAFTGANQQRKGYLESAEDGTLLLDEIGDLPQTVQVKFLRVLQEKSFYRVGGRSEVPFRARLICSTYKDIEQMVSEDAFREDLYYRVNVIPIHIQPLRNRTDDILPLANYYLSKFAEEMDRDMSSFTPKARHALTSYDFPGNVRELKNRLERAVALCRGQSLSAHDIFPEHYRGEFPEHDSDDLPPLHDHMVDVQKDYIIQALERHGWQISETAGALKISRKTLWEKMKRYGIRKQH